MSKISVKNLDLYYGDFKALKNINLEIEPNKITAFIGPSGCGKSTLLKSINRMNDLVEGCRIDGEILLDGQNIFKGMDVNVLRKRVGMVFQKPNPFPMSIYDNIAYGPRTHGIRSKAKLDDIVEKSLRNAAIWDECKDRLKKSALGMSGGQQQRLCIARALAVEPEVLLMDEPLSNLDAKLRIEMRNAIKQIQRQVDITTVYVTHDQEEALAVSDRIAVMNGGVICQIGRPADIYKRPKNVFVSTFIGLSNLLDGHIVKKGDKTSISFKENEDWLVDMDNLSRGVEDGEDVIVSVRPEEFDMEPGTKEGIRGVIRSSVFLGLTTHYFITTGSGQELEILQTQEGHDILPDGSAVTLTVKAGRINVFRRATEETLIREEGL